MDNTDGSSLSEVLSPTVGQPAVATYTAVEQVFHRLFPQVPLSEKLVESRQCALMTKKKKFARMGTLYASSLRICFSSSFLKEPVMVRWEDVVFVTKGTSFLFDTIVITTKQNEEFYFSGFLSGGTSQIFKLLKTLWTVRARYASSDSPDVPTSETLSTPIMFSALSNSVPSFVQATFSNKRTLSPSSDGEKLKDEDALFQETSTSPSSTRSTKVDESERNNPLNDMDDIIDVYPPSRNLSNCAQIRKRSLSLPSKVAENSVDSSSDRFEVSRYFPSVPKSEPLIDYFQCSYVSGVHRIGKLYITTNYILFSSVLMAEGLQIRFKDVKTIEKEQTMMILDGIAITLRSGTMHSFTSFVSRDAAFNILTHFLNAMKTLHPPDETPTGETNEAALESSDFTTTTSEPVLSKIPVVESLKEFNKVATDYGTGFSDYECFTKELTEPLVLPEGKTVFDVFKVCFDDGSLLLEQYHKERNDTDQKYELWRPAGNGSPSFSGQRLFTCTTIIKAVMAKACVFTEYQRYAFMNVGGNTPTLVVHFSGQAVGVMFADSFRAEALMTFTQTDSTVTMRSFGYIQFLRDVWVKGKITRTSLDVEMPDCYRKLGNLLIQRLNRFKGSAAGNAESDEKSSSSPSLVEEVSSFSGPSGYWLSKFFLLLNGRWHRVDILFVFLGLLTCFFGFFSIFFRKIDKSSLLNVKNRADIEEMSLILCTFFHFCRPIVLSVLSLGVLVFYRILCFLSLPLLSSPKL